MIERALMVGGRALRPDQIEQRRAGERAAHAEPCPRCGQGTLVGLDADVCAMTVRLAPTELDVPTELLALLEDGITYRLRAVAGRREIELRDRHQIISEPATPGHVRILRRHACPEATA